MLVARYKACSLSVLRTWVQVPRCSSVYFIRMFVYVYFQTIFLIPVPSIHLLFTSNKTNTGGTPTLIWTQHQQLSEAHRWEWDAGLTTLRQREPKHRWTAVLINSSSAPRLIWPWSGQRLQLTWDLCCWVVPAHRRWCCCCCCCLPVSPWKALQGPV